MTTTKRCFKCGEVKPLTEFYQHPEMADGHLGKCKTCAKNDSSVRYRKKVGDTEFVEKERKRGREKYHRLYGFGRNWTSPEGAPNIKNNASTKLNYAVRSGRIIKPTRCGDCGKEHSRIHGHHEDYTKPLAVHWVCPLCHRKRHATDPSRILGAEARRNGAKLPIRTEARKWTRYCDRSPE